MSARQPLTFLLSSLRSELADLRRHLRAQDGDNGHGHVDHFHARCRMQRMSALIDMIETQHSAIGGDECQAH